MAPRKQTAKKATRKRAPKPPETNRQAVDAWLKGQRLAGRAQALAVLVRDLADAVDRDSSVMCAACKRSGAQPTLWAEYRRASDELAALLAEEGAGDEEGATVVRLAGGLRS